MTTQHLFAHPVRRRVVLCAVALMICFALQSAVLAGKDGGEVGLDVGMTDLTDNTANDSGTRFGLRGGYHFTPWFELEGQASRTSADEAGLEARLSTLFVNGVFSFRPTPRIEPYVLTGVGRANLKLDGSALGSSIDDSGAAYQVGVGSRFFVNKSRNVAIRAEVTRLHERSFDEGTDYNNVTTGVTWRFGRKS